MLCPSENLQMTQISLLVWVPLDWWSFKAFPTLIGGDFELSFKFLEFIIFQYFMLNSLC